MCGYLLCRTIYNCLFYHESKGGEHVSGFIQNKLFFPVNSYTTCISSSLHFSDLITPSAIKHFYLMWILAPSLKLYFFSRYTPIFSISTVKWSTQHSNISLQIQETGGQMTVASFTETNWARSFLVRVFQVLFPFFCSVFLLLVRKTNHILVKECNLSLG